MKKLEKKQLKLDKEVISSLSKNDLSAVKGGLEFTDYTFCKCSPIYIETYSPGCKTMGPEMECMVSYNGRVTCHCVGSVDICIMTDKC